MSSSPDRLDSPATPSSSRLRQRRWVAVTALVVVAAITVVAITVISRHHKSPARPSATSPTASTGPTSTSAPRTSASGASTPAPRSSATGAPTKLTLRVEGDHFVDGNAKVVQLRGVNRAGTEFRCVQDIPYGFITDDNSTDGTTAAYIPRVVSALRTWNRPGAATNAINAVRIPLNENCWFGQNGAQTAYSGAPYRAFVKAEVDALIAAGMYPIIDLHWSGAGSHLATQQDVAPNREHSLPFWIEVARMFKGSPAVAFDLFEEPRLWCYSAACKSDYTVAASYAWGCYRDGCTYTRTKDDYVKGQETGTIAVVGMQTLIDAIRQEGADNVILVEGLGYANSLDNWVKFKPNDPRGQLAAEIHTYANSGANVNNTTYLDASLSAAGLADYPLLVGEFGETICNAKTTGFAEETMDWADRHGYGYLAWGWDRGENCAGPSLVTSNAGVPSQYGTIVRDHLRQRDRTGP